MLKITDEQKGGVRAELSWTMMNCLRTQNWLEDKAMTRNLSTDKSQV